jgi:hypothetical protein
MSSNKKRRRRRRITTAPQEYPLLKWAKTADLHPVVPEGFPRSRTAILDGAAPHQQAELRAWYVGHDIVDVADALCDGAFGFQPDADRRRIVEALRNEVANALNRDPQFLGTPEEIKEVLVELVRGILHLHIALFSESVEAFHDLISRPSLGQLAHRTVDPLSVLGRTPAARAALAFVSQVLSIDHIISVLNSRAGLAESTLLCTLARVATGSHTYVVSRYLQDLFSIVSLDRGTIPPPPCQAMWLRLPYSGIEFDVDHNAYGTTEMSGVQVIDTVSPNGERVLVMGLCALPHDDIRRPPPDLASAPMMFRLPRQGNCTAQEAIDSVAKELRFRDRPAHWVESRTEAAQLYFHTLYYLSTTCETAMDIYASEIDRVKEILRTQRVDGRKASKHAIKKAERFLAKHGGTHTHLLAPALVRGLAESKQRLPGFGTRNSGERRQSFVLEHKQRYWVGTGENRRREWKVKKAHFNPRLEGDLDIEALLYVKTYTLE